MPWHWRMMQKLMRNWLVSSKLIWGTWQTLTKALENLKNLHFNRLLLNKVHVWAKNKYRGILLDGTEYWCNIWRKKKLTCAFKNDIRNLANFHQSMFGSLKIETLMESFYPKQKMHELKICRGDLSWQWRMMQNDEEELTC